MQERRDARKEGCTIGVLQKRRDSSAEGCKFGSAMELIKQDDNDNFKGTVIFIRNCSFVSFRLLNVSFRINTDLAFAC